MPRVPAGQVGFSAVVMPAAPASTAYLDVYASEMFNLLFIGTTLHAITFGDYPDIIRNLVDESSRRQNLTTSRLPYFTEEEKKDLVGKPLRVQICCGWPSCG